MPKKVTLTDYEFAVLIQALKVWRASLVAELEIVLIEKSRKDLLSDIRLDVEEIEEKLQRIRQGGSV
jgi:hypothetical protein